MDIPLAEGAIAALIGAGGGLLLGLAARLGRFCTLGAVEDFLYGNTDHRLRMWGVAIGTAMIAVFAMIAGGLVPAETTPYLATGWNPVAHALGGLMFGVGMALAGNCGFGALARLGGGDLRAFVIVLVMGISAYVVMSGPLAGLRIWLLPPDLIQTGEPTGYAHLLSRSFGVPVAVPGILAGIAVLALSAGRKSFLAQPRMLGWGTVVGLAVAMGWAGSAWLYDDGFGGVAVQSYTFAAPLGDTILYAMTASGTPLGFAVGAVAGVWTGAFIGSLCKGHFRWEACEDPRELKRQIFGAGLMGGGAVLAMGCSVGQGITAMSILSYGAPLSLAGIFAGVALGLRAMIAGFDAA
ncbi:YeeE/YedE family protein [Chachezhania sediminis]|uniref:YeeE/YedE family protein n=1 Tax=Chachezhania sediminis TaxID=2599291 RepID=UPI00131D781E|nr:YeeE/YedE family protein [Chachezhania sediminis]